ncbi:hypothetical protein BCR41DRAFT_422776 [Lobosporangium transversale]|uniref:C2H2-type domain-containing protein n=1 Tax=Lobosporangium transversale TaxID=64571 RepID=A0A1Y2GKW0_9FUNG|nr:hypothetical protein BCR41DRAFT_422776 [Lobosporangium transversale]ORZ13884.1 hypothetical protein BCR41DRAFT_422776 [Lobosporangium transversale]|eukprot:XP_021880668.1 hypothetical protein BCR41DRAFT_422776 [Lobosporangium transversale]
MQSADQKKNLKGREHHCSSSTTAKSTTNSSVLPTSFPLQSPSSLPSSSSLPSPSTTDAASPTPPTSPSPQLPVEPTDYTFKASRSGSEPLVCANFGSISLSAIDPYHLLTPGNNHSSHNFEPKSRDSIMLMTIQQDRTQEILQRRQVQENQLYLQTPFLHNQFHPQQLLQVMHPSSHLQPFPPPPLTQLSSSPSLSPSSLPPPLPPTTLTPPSPSPVAPLSAPHLIQYEHSHYHTHPNQQQPAALQRSTSGIESYYQQYQHLSPQQQRSMLQQRTQQLPLQQYQNGGSYQKRGRFFSWSASTTPMTPLSGNFGPLPLANMETFGNVLYVDPHQYQNQLNQHHQQQQQQLAHQGRIPNKQQSSQQQWVTGTTLQSLTPDRYFGNDFDWITGISDLGTPSANKMTSTRGPVGSAVGLSESGAPAPASENNGGISANPYNPFGPMAFTSTANPRITPHPFQTIACTGLAASLGSESADCKPKFEEPATAKHNTKHAADDMTTAESLRPAQRRRLGSSRELSISSKAMVTALPTVAIRTASQATTESSPRSTQPPTPLSPIASFPNSQVPQHPLQKDASVKKDTSTTETISTASNASSTAILPLAAPGPILLGMPSSTHNSKAFSTMPPQGPRTTTSSPAFGRHHPVTSTAPFPAMSKPIPRARHSSNNNSSYSSNSSHIISSSPMQSTPYREGYCATSEAGAINSKGLQATSKRSSLSNSTQPSPTIDTKADPIASMGSHYAPVVPNSIPPLNDNGEDEGSEGESVRSAKCPHCDKEFQSKGLLRSHIVSHSSDRPFVCWDCADKSYKRNHDLLRHRREKHNVDGVSASPRGSVRNQIGGTRDGIMERIKLPPTVASQSIITTHRDIYPSHEMMFLGSGSGLADLSASSSRPTLSPYSGINYSHDQHMLPVYPPHSRGSVELGQGVNLDPPSSSSYILK